jgi:hypothetical protein
MYLKILSTSLSRFQVNRAKQSQPDREIAIVPLHTPAECRLKSGTSLVRMNSQLVTSSG